MAKTKKSKYIKSVFLVLSTLLAPCLFFSIFSNFIAGIYVYFVVPYLLWKFWFNQDDYKVNPTSYYRKAPIILVIVAGMFFAEILLYFLIEYPPSASEAAVIAIYAVSLLIFRCLSYAMMIFVWQPSILKSGKKRTCLGIIFLYFLALMGLSYLFITAPTLNSPSFFMSEDYLSPHRKGQR